MCLIVLAWQADKHYPLVVAANRDEEFARRTAALGAWQDVPHVLAGRDLEAGGTWMGITRDGRFAAITNFRDPARKQPQAPSRGRLVADFLEGRESPSDYLARIERPAAGCNGFNLLVADTHELWLHSNVSGEKQQLMPGVYGISNHLLDTPWPKLVAAKQRFADALPGLPESTLLFELLADDTRHPDETLPVTGVPLERERELSAIFVKTPGYGTRSSSVLLRTAEGKIDFEERTWREHGIAGARIHMRT